MNVAPERPPEDNDSALASWARTARYAVIILVQRLPSAIAALIGWWLRGHG